MPARFAVLVCEIRGPDAALWPIVRLADLDARQPHDPHQPMQILSGRKTVPLAISALRRGLAALIQKDTTRELHQQLRTLLDETTI
jgi:hypothetical protein